MTKRKPGNPGAARGELSGRAKLTGAHVADIRRRHANGESMQALAAELGVGWTAIQKAVRGITWRHLPKPRKVRAWRRRWTATELVTLARRPDAGNAELARELGRSAHAVEIRRSRLGLLKPAETGSRKD